MLDGWTSFFLVFELLSFLFGSDREIQSKTWERKNKSGMNFLDSKRKQIYYADCPICGRNLYESESEVNEDGGVLQGLESLAQAVGSKLRRSAGGYPLAATSAVIMFEFLRLDGEGRHVLVESLHG